jgi:transcriptional regulator with XRE-family HTH domain
VNASALSDEARRLILERVKRKLEFEKTLRALGIARGSLHNYLHGFRTIPDSVVYKALQHLEEQEFNEIVQGVNKLRAIGIIRGDGSIDFPNTTGHCTSMSPTSSWALATGRPGTLSPY